MSLPVALSAESLTAVVDTREQTPLDLAPLQTTRGTLHVGDYSVRGLESVVAIERKNLGDLVACCGRERDRFQRELDALRGWPVSAVVVEASWHDIEAGNWRANLTAKQVRSSLTAWMAQGHTIIMTGDHATAAVIVRDLLYYAARYRYREARALLAGMEVATA